MKYFLFVFVLSILMHVFDFIKWSEAKLSRSAYVVCVLIAVAAGALGYDWGMESSGHNHHNVSCIGGDVNNSLVLFGKNRIEAESVT